MTNKNIKNLRIHYLNPNSAKNRLSTKNQYTSLCIDFLYSRGKLKRLFMYLVKFKK